MDADKLRAAHEQFQDGAITALELALRCLEYSLESEDIEKYAERLRQIYTDTCAVVAAWMTE